jgi:hypothetical protein
MSDPTSLEEAGRTASSAELHQRLAEASAPYLSGALQNESLNEELVLVIAGNRAASPKVLRTVGSNPKWVRSYEVKRKLVQNPHTPRDMALNLVKFLFWKDLARVSDDFFVFPPLRRRAEVILCERLPEMALGEQISLARVAGRGLIAKLMTIRNVMVVEATLWNSRLTTTDLLRAIRDKRTAPDVLVAMGNHPRWKSRSDIRVALAKNPRTPLSATLGHLTSLPERELASLATDPETPRAVKLAAKRVLAARGNRGARAR